MTDEMPFDEQLRRERAGANAGLNPMFGEWQHRFDFAPVPYGNGAAQRGDFRAAIQAELTNQWLYSNEIHRVSDFGGYPGVFFNQLSIRDATRLHVWRPGSSAGGACYVC